MKKKVKILFLLFTLLVLFNNNVSADEYEFIIGNKSLNSTNNVITDGNDGRAIWDIDTKTLVLENFDYEGKGTAVDVDFEGFPKFYTLFGISDPDDVTVVVKGDNTFKYLDNTFEDDEEVFEMLSYFVGNVTFKGPGKIKFIASNDDVSFAVGLYAFKDLNVYDATIEVQTFKSQSESLGIHSEKILSMTDASFIINIADCETGYGVTTHELKLDSSYLEANLKSSGKLIGIEANSASGVYSIVKINLDSSSEFLSGMSIEDLIQLDKSKVVIDTYGKGIVTDKLTVTNTNMRIAAEDGVISRGTDIDFSSYLAGNGSILLNITAIPSITGYVAYEDGVDVLNYKFLNAYIAPNDGIYKYDLEKENIKVLTEDISNLFALTEVDKLKISYNLDAFFTINLSDNYEKYDLELVNSNLGNYKLGKIIDIDLLKKIGTEGRNRLIPNLTDKIKLSYKLDESLIENRTYKVLRVHNGKVDILDALFNSETKELSFETDRFSTYAILYKDIVIEENPNTGDNIISSILIGGISLVCLISCGLYAKRKLGSN